MSELSKTPQVPVVRTKSDPLGALTAYRPPGLPYYRLCTIPLHTRDDVMRVNALVEESYERLWDIRGEVIEVRDVIVVCRPEEDRETLELSDVLRLVLVSPDGSSYQTASAPARGSLLRQMVMLAQMTPPRLPPYDPPLRVSLVAQRSRDTGRDWLHLVVIPDEEEVTDVR